MATIDEPLIAELVIETDENRAIAIPVGSEVDCQIATARAYPRSMKAFREKVRDLVTSDFESAAECTYKLPARDGKKIEGPSARFAEIVTYCFGNCRVSSRIVDEGEETLKAQGMFWDLESNVAKSFEVVRSITDKYGNRYKPSMIATTATAAGSIALRTATLRAIPKSIWQPLYLESIEAAKVKPEELEQRRAVCIDYFTSKGITLEQILASVGVDAVEKITPSKLSELRGYATAVKQGEATLDEIFEGAYKQPGARARDSDLNAKFKEPKVNPWETILKTPDDKEAKAIYDAHCGPKAKCSAETAERCSAAWNERQGITEKEQADSLFT